MGNIVTTIDASIGDVIDKPTKKGNWFKPNENTEAKNNNKISFFGTCSFFTTNEISQNKIAPPAILKNVRANGLRISGIKLRDIGVFNPKSILANKSAK